MKRYFYILLFLFFLSCHKDKDPVVVIEECVENCIKLSELQSEHDYYAPINIFNDLPDSEIQKIVFNNRETEFKYGQVLPLEKCGFYKLQIHYTEDSIADATILFTLKTAEREHAEWGIEAWTPKMFTTENLSGSEDIEAIYPRIFTDNINVPFVFYVRQGTSLVQTYSEARHLSSGEAFYIKRGVGSVNLDASVLENDPEFDLGGLTTQPALSKRTSFDLELSGEISNDIIIPSNSFVRITSDVHIPVGFSLTIGAGCLIAIDEAVNITNEGPVVFQGVQDNPIFVTCSEKDKFWGGFMSEGTSSMIEGTYTIFCQSGYHNSPDYMWGHAQRQALFYTTNSTLDLDHCYMLDHIGQVFYPTNAELDLESILVQRAKTSGQLNYSAATIQNSIFTDFPDDSQVYRDEDNDALYISASDVTIDNCIFMFTKDDGVDSGGDLGGTVTVSNTRFEACFHEGSALSSKGDVIKTHTFNNCVFANCGQGLELGFSSTNHQVIANNCKFLDNYIGIRYGDNYNWSLVNGTMQINNSQSLNNGKDVWNMVRMDWSPKISNMQFENTQVSSFVFQYPGLEIISE